MPIGPISEDISADSLAALIDRIARQDRDAFARLFHALAPRIKAYLVRLGGDAGLADEITQEVMLSIWRRAGTYDPTRSTVFAWVFAIARNRRIDRLRRDRAPEIDPADPLFISDQGIPQDQAIEIAEQGNRLRRAIETLPAEQSELIEMAFYQDMAHSSIAAERQLPLGTVKSRLRLALARLRRAMSETGGE